MGYRQTVLDRMHVIRRTGKIADIGHCPGGNSPTENAQEFDRRTGVRDVETRKPDGRKSLRVRSQFEHDGTPELLDFARSLRRYEFRITRTLFGNIVLVYSCTQ